MLASLYNVAPIVGFVSAYPDPALVIDPPKPGTVKSAVPPYPAADPVHATFWYVPGAYPDPLDVILPVND